MSFGVGSNRTTFQDGEAIASQDLTQIGLNASQRAWETPGFANLLAFDLPGSSYDIIFDTTSSVMYGRRLGVFTVGGGLAVSAPLSPARGTVLGSGFAGLWDETSPTPSDNNPSSAKMSWIRMPSNNWTWVHVAAGAGNTRYDIVHCAAVKSNLSVTRHGKDATTGAKFSLPTNVAEQLNLDIAVTQGTQSTGTPSLPSFPAGRHVLYAARVSDTAITELHDFTIPVGPLVTAEGMPSLVPGLGGSIPWAVDGAFLTGAASSGAGPLYAFPPSGIMGNSNSRILGFQMNHALKAGDTVKVVRMVMTGTYTELIDVTSALGTIDGTDREASFIDLRGGPAGVALGWATYWGNGEHIKGPSLHQTIGLLIHAVGSGSKVHAIKWSAIQG
jgi:hypothetical protein